MATNQPIEIDIFRAGTQTASNGSTFTFSIGDLQQVVNSFNPTIFRPPLILSHDTGGKCDRALAEDELCYGIPDYLKLVGNTLKAGFKKIAPQMVNWVRSGRLHSVSSSFYLPNSPNNPYPGKLSLRHIAALGSTPPAVKGLAALNFNIYSYEEGVVNFDMPVNSVAQLTADLFQRFREYLIGKESLEVAESVLPADAIAQLRSMGDSESMLLAQISNLNMRISELEQEEEDEDEEEEGMTSSYAEMMDYMKAMKAAGMTVADVASATGMSEEDTTSICNGTKKPTPKQKKALNDLLMNNSADMSEREEALRLREEALALRETEIEKQQVTDFVEGLIKQGKIIAAKRDDTVTLLLSCPHNDNVEFSQGSKTPRQALMDSLKDQPSWNYGGEIVTPLNQVAITPNFSAPTGFGVDKRSGDIYRRAIAFCQANQMDANNPEDWQQALEQGAKSNA